MLSNLDLRYMASRKQPYDILQYQSFELSISKILAKIQMFHVKDKQASVDAVR